MTQPLIIRRRHFLQLAAGATGALVLNACNTAGSDDGSEATPLTMSMGSAPWVGQLPLYIAQEKGFFAEEGLDFSLSLFGASGDYISAFSSDNIDSVAP
ncbi:MAG: ABC transporter substrate-binding protein, partial [Cyanobacteria bacterium J06554_3]